VFPRRLAKPFYTRLIEIKKSKNPFLERLLLAVDFNLLAVDFKLLVNGFYLLANNVYFCMHKIPNYTLLYYARKDYHS
jgi:hypothetical protein